MCKVRCARKQDLPTIGSLVWQPDEENMKPWMAAHQHALAMVRPHRNIP